MDRIVISGDGGDRRRSAMATQVDGPTSEHQRGPVARRLLLVARLAMAAGTGISNLSIAVEYTFPCASVLSEMVPPPSSAPCNRKLRALRLGRTNRSTLRTMPLKWR